MCAYRYLHVLGICYRPFSSIFYVSLKSESKLIHKLNPPVSLIKVFYPLCWLINDEWTVLFC